MNTRGTTELSIRQKNYEILNTRSFEQSLKELMHGIRDAVMSLDTNFAVEFETRAQSSPVLMNYYYKDKKQQIDTIYASLFQLKSSS